MLDWLWSGLASTTSVVVFFSIFLVGVIFSSFSLILGGHGDHDFGHDFSHDTDHSGDHGGDHSGGGLANFFSVGMLSIRGFALFSTGFGGAGMIAQIYSGRTLFSTIVGSIFGYVFALLLLLIVKMLRAQESNSLIDTKTAVGASGTVVTSIPDKGIGEIRCIISGVQMTKTAVSKNGVLIRSGTRVRIEEVDGATMIVVPINAT